MSRIPQPNSPVVSAVSGGATDAVNRAVAAGNTERSLKAQKEAQQAAAESREKQQLLQLQQNRDLAEQKMSFDRDQAAVRNQLSRDQLSFEQDQARIANQRAQQQTELTNARTRLQLELDNLDKEKTKLRGKVTAEHLQKVEDLTTQIADLDSKNAVVGTFLGQATENLDGLVKMLEEKQEENVASEAGQRETGAEIGRTVASNITFSPDTNLEGIDRNNFRGPILLTKILIDTDEVSRRDNTLELARSLGVKTILNKDGEPVDISSVGGRAAREDAIRAREGFGNPEDFELRGYFDLPFGIGDLGEEFSAESILRSPEFQEKYQKRVQREIRTGLVEVFRGVADKDFNEAALEAAITAVYSGGTPQEVTKLVRMSGVSDLTFGSALNQLGETLRQQALELRGEAADFAGEAVPSALGRFFDTELDISDVDITKGPQQKFLAAQYADAATELSVFGNAVTRENDISQRAFTSAVNALKRGLESQNLLELDVRSLVGFDGDPDEGPPLPLDMLIADDPILSQLSPEEISELQDRTSRVREVMREASGVDEGPPQFTTMDQMTDLIGEQTIDRARLEAEKELMDGRLDAIIEGLSDDPRLQPSQSNVDAATNVLRNLL